MGDAFDVQCKANGLSSFVKIVDFVGVDSMITAYLQDANYLLETLFCNFLLVMLVISKEYSICIDTKLHTSYILLLIITKLLKTSRTNRRQRLSRLHHDPTCPTSRPCRAAIIRRNGHPIVDQSRRRARTVFEL